jgi:glycosyltransferase involved in cell wall biosynthesis
LRVLLVCSKPPFPPTDGGTLANWELARGLAEAGHAVHVLAMATPKHPDQSRARARPAGITLESVPVDTRLSLFGALQNLAAAEPYAVARFRSPAFAARLQKRLLDGFDVVHVQGMPAALHLSLLRQHAAAPVVLGVHDVEREIWMQRAAAAPPPLRRWLRSQARRFGRLEAQAWAGVDGLVAISPAVAEACAATARGPLLVLPPSIEVPASCPPLPGRLDIYHLGSMDWSPNVDGLRWFLAEVWPRLRERLPDLELHLAGRRSRGFAAARGLSGVVVEGEVDDPAVWVRRHGVLVVPVRSGSGLRLKIVESMAQGRPVVTTPQGAEGLGTEPGRHLLVAGDAESFAAQVRELVQAPLRAASLGEAAWRFAGEHFTRAPLARRLLEFYASLRSRVDRA